MSERVIGSSGSQDYDKKAEGEHEGVLEDGAIPVALPGETKLGRIVVDGVTYSHVANDVDGRWIYRRA